MSEEVKTEEAKAASKDVVKTSVIESVAKWSALVVSAGGFLWGIATTLITNRVQAETRQLEARKPFLDYQLQLYKEAVQTTQILATTQDIAEKQQKEKRFWQLYWGELGLVENGSERTMDGGVETAMVRFGETLKERGGQDALAHRSLILARACRNSLAASWGINDWKSSVNPSTESQAH